MKTKQDEKNIKVVGENIKRYRKRAGISQSQLAFECELQLSQIARIEKGIINTSVSNIFRIASALQIHPKHFFDTE